MATMNTNIKINIVEPVDSTNNTNTDEANETDSLIITQDTDINVPDTGLFTHGIGGREVAVLSTAIFIILTIVASLSLHYSKKHGKVTKLAKLLSRYKSTLKHNKATTLGLTILAIVVSLGTLATLIKTGVNAIDPVDSTNSNSTSNESTNGSNTTITTDDIDIIEASLEDGEVEIPLGDKPVFAKIPVTITVDEAMSAGYTIKAYAEDPDFTSTNKDKTITMITPIDDIAESLSLTDNTWGLSITNPSLPTDNIFYSLPQSQDNAAILTDSDYEETEANSTFTFYYSIYLTPDLPYGTYIGASVSYDIEENLVPATVTFDGNGLYFNGDPGQTTNVVRYTEVEMGKTKLYSHTPNVSDKGVQTEGEMYPIGLNETFVYEFSDAVEVKISIMKVAADGTCGPNIDQFFSFWQGNHPDYTAVDNWESGIKLNGSTGKYLFSSGSSYTGVETTVEGNALTFAYTTSDHRGGFCGDSGYGYYAIITATDVNGNPAHASHEYATFNLPFRGEYKTPITEKYAAYNFIGWSTDENAITADFVDADDVESNMALSEGKTATLYAIWSPIVDIAYDGNGATAGSMESTYNNKTTVLLHDGVMVGDTIDLYAPNYKKDGYGFVGWSIDKDAWTHLTNDDTSDDPIIYGPNQTVTIDKHIVNALDEKTNTVTLYAVWSPAEKDLQGNPVYLQHWTGCSALTPTSYDGDTNTLNVGNNTVTALTDNRDGNVYTIARLADGNCWMVENLRLDDTAIITVSNTNNPLVVNGTVAIKNSYGNTYNHLSPNSMSWCSGDDESEFCRGRSYLNTNNTNLGGNGMVASYNSGDYDSQWYSYGNYYNWYSATAGRGEYDTTAIMTASGDICPSGWRLPYGGYDNKDTNGSFMYLNQQLGNTSSDGHNWLVFPNNFIRSGVFVEGQSLSYRGELSAYWSSMHTDFWNAYAAWLNSSGTMWASGHTPDSRGGSVRCVTLAE